MLPKNAHELFMSYELPAHVSGNRRTVSDKRYGIGISKLFNEPESGCCPVEGVVPEHNGENEYTSVEDRSVLTRHRILRSIRNQHHHQQIGNADRAGLSSKDTHQYENCQIDDRSTHEQ